ncbi:MAG: anaerobic glycerol-3-phosphate dehydrogenase subunit A [Anaerolineae bacterium]|nr:anaerobic glycerol-3-phosphate dehydrogenase subunit A [Anaerolineae bacterium]
MQSITCDVLIIGGGATGCGVFFDLAQRGFRVVLAEMNDIGTGTSGRYHGLLHSGGRYAVRDPESAKECAEENVILRKIAPHVIEDTGGMFVGFRQDPLDYVEPFKRGCAAAGIPIEDLKPAEALKLAPALDPTLVTAIRVPDGSLDSFDLVHSLVEGAAQFGGQALIYHKVIGFERTNDMVTGALLENRKTGDQVRLHTSYIVNASGPWASLIADMIGGIHIKMRHSKGIMIAMNVRWVHTIINRLKPPSDGDILVPVGTVCVIGTTSITVPSPDDFEITPAEVTQMLDEGEIMIPAFRQARALRTWAGVRPLYESPKGDNLDSEGRDVKRTFAVLDHAEEGVGGIASIVGGKLTTYRQMAERISDFVGGKLGRMRPCLTATTVLPIPAHGLRRYHALPKRQDELEHAPNHRGLICECEIVTRPQLEDAIKKAGPTVKLDDLRRDLRLGMGPCQAGFCAYRAAGVLQETCQLPTATTIDALRDFVQERFRGNRPLLWGHQLRQALLDETIYRRSLGLAAVPEQAEAPQT